MFHSKIICSSISALILTVMISISWCPQEALALDCGKNASHNAFFGRLSDYDSLLYMNHLKVDYKWLRIVTTDVNYPSFRNIQGIIHYIEIVDQFTDGTGGCAYITDGGIGEKKVSIYIKSKRSHGLDFIIRIYGIPL